MKSVLIFFAILLSPLCYVSLWAGPANDLFVNRTPLTGTNVTVSGSNFPEREPNQAKIPAAENILWFYSVWYLWTSPTNGVLYLSGSTTVGNFYMSIRVYRGSAVNALSLADSTPDGGFPLTSGDTVAIQVASICYLYSRGGGTGPFTLALSLA